MVFFVIKTKPIFLRLHRITLFFSVFSARAEVKAKRSKKFEPKLPLKQAVHLVQSRKKVETKESRVASVHSSFAK